MGNCFTFHVSTATLIISKLEIHKLSEVEWLISSNSDCRGRETEVGRD